VEGSQILEKKKMVEPIKSGNDMHNGLEIKLCACVDWDGDCLCV